MFAVIYRFTVKKNRDKDFIEGWKSLTKLIYEYEGILGSRLHKSTENKYVAYAQWPSKEIWENAGGKLPDAADSFRFQMKDACEKMSTEYELDLVCDLTQIEPFSNAFL